ncbi:hypothetical protein ACS0TY_035462 [Phlomoides rotata]
MNEWGCQVQALCTHKNNIIRWKLKTDSDVAQFLNKYKDQDLVIYVSLKKVNNALRHSSFERSERDFMHFAPQNTHVSVDDVGPSAVPTGDSYHNSISDEEDDPLHEQAYKEYRFYYRANPTQAEASKHDCGEFQLSLMSCIHAAATIRFANLNLSDFVSPYFHAKTIQEMWGGSVKPVPHPDHWVLPEWINSTSCDPPMQPRQAGRPRQSRRPSGLESSTSTRRSAVCSTCQQPCHNRSNCTQTVNFSQEESTGIPSSDNQSRAPTTRAV